MYCARLVNRFMKINSTKESFIKAFEEAKYNFKEDIELVDVFIVNLLDNKRFNTINWLIQKGYDINRIIDNKLIIDDPTDIDIVNYLYKKGISKKLVQNV